MLLYAPIVIAIVAATSLILYKNKLINVNTILAIAVASVFISLLLPVIMGRLTIFPSDIKSSSTFNFGIIPAVILAFIIYMVMILLAVILISVLIPEKTARNIQESFRKGFLGKLFFILEDKLQGFIANIRLKPENSSGIFPFVPGKSKNTDSESLIEVQTADAMLNQDDISEEKALETREETAATTENHEKNSHDIGSPHEEEEDINILEKPVDTVQNIDTMGIETIDGIDGYVPENAFDDTNSSPFNDYEVEKDYYESDTITDNIQPSEFSVKQEDITVEQSQKHKIIPELQDSSPAKAEGVPDEADIEPLYTASDIEEVLIAETTDADDIEIIEKETVTISEPIENQQINEGTEAIDWPGDKITDSEGNVIFEATENQQVEETNYHDKHDKMQTAYESMADAGDEEDITSSGADGLEEEGDITEPVLEGNIFEPDEVYDNSSTLTIDDCIDKAFQLKTAGDLEGAILYYMYALDKKPENELVFWVILDICVLYKSLGQSELALDILRSYQSGYGEIMDNSIRKEIENNLKG